MTAIFHAQFLSSSRRLVIPRSDARLRRFFSSWFPPSTPSTSADKAAPPRGWVWGGGVYPRGRKSQGQQDTPPRNSTTRRHLDRFGGVIIFTPPAPRPFPLQRTDPRPEIFSAALADPQGYEGTGEAQHQDAGSRNGD